MPLSAGKRALRSSATSSSPAIMPYRFASSARMSIFQACARACSTDGRGWRSELIVIASASTSCAGTTLPKIFPCGPGDFWNR